MRRLIWVSAKGTCYLSIYRSIDLRPSICLKWRPPSLVASRKHAYIILTPFSKTGIYRGIHILLISPQKLRLRVPVRTVSSRWFETSTRNLCFEQKYEKKYQNFLFENFHFLVVKFSVYLNRQVFVMVSIGTVTRGSQVRAPVWVNIFITLWHLVAGVVNLEIRRISTKQGKLWQRRSGGSAEHRNSNPRAQKYGCTFFSRSYIWWPVWIQGRVWELERVGK